MKPSIRNFVTVKEIMKRDKNIERHMRNLIDLENQTKLLTEHCNLLRNTKKIANGKADYHV